MNSNSRYPLIRAMNSKAFRSGEWARIIGVEITALGPFGQAKTCFLVEFLDGETAPWPIEGVLHEYEFNSSSYKYDPPSRESAVKNAISKWSQLRDCYHHLPEFRRAVEEFVRMDSLEKAKSICYECKKEVPLEESIVMLGHLPHSKSCRNDRHTTVFCSGRCMLLWWEQARLVSLD